MTQALAQALTDGTKPFHDITCAYEKLTLDQLWASYRAAVLVLTNSGLEKSYLQCADWHWHDGFIMEPEPLPGADWLKWLETPESLVDAWQTEDYVHPGVYPESMEWYLRFLLWEDAMGIEQIHPDPATYGMDVTGHHELVDSVQVAIAEVCAVVPVVQPAVTWFRNSGWTLHESKPIL